MYTIFSLLIFFLIAVFSILLFYKLKNSRRESLEKGTCPVCKESSKTFKDEENGTFFKVDVIKSRLLKNHGCSGSMEVEYRCSNCGLKEVHTVPTNSGCGI